MCDVKVLHMGICSDSKIVPTISSFIGYILSFHVWLPSRGAFVAKPFDSCCILI